MEECRTLYLNLISAKQLKNVSLFGKMDVYAVVSHAGSYQKLKTPVNKGGGPNPTWNFPIKFTISEAPAVHNRLTLVIRIKAAGIFINRQLGEVWVPIKELMKSDGNQMRFLSYRVRRPSGKMAKGELSFSYKFGEKFSVKEEAEEPMTAYPPPPPPRQGGYGYAFYAPPPPPPPPVYGGYPYPPQKRPTDSGSGMGFGTGLLGGMLIGAMLSDGGDCDDGF